MCACCVAWAGNPLSCVITRGSEFPQNLSGGTETFIPERLLYGILPQVGG